MEDRQHGVRLATAERGLKLDHGLAPLAVQPLRDLRQQEPHPFCNESPLVKGRGILVLARGLAVTDGGDVCRELRLLKGALEDVGWGTLISRHGFRVVIAISCRSVCPRYCGHGCSGDVENERGLASMSFTSCSAFATRSRRSQRKQQCLRASRRMRLERKHHTLARHGSRLIRVDPLWTGRRSGRNSWKAGDRRPDLCLHGSGDQTNWPASVAW